MSSQFHKGEKVTIPDSAKSKAVPRTQEEINKNYAQLCTELGDKTVKQKGFQQEIDQLMKYVESLSNELAARQKMDAESSKAESPKQDQSFTDETYAQQLAPETTGVDVSPSQDANAQL